MFVDIKEQSTNSSIGSGRVAKLLDGWPIAVLVFALAFTVVWIGFLCWLVLRLLHLI